MLVWTLAGLAHFGQSWAAALGVRHGVNEYVRGGDVIVVGWHKPAKCNALTAGADRRFIVWCGHDAERFAQPATLRPDDVHLVANAELLPMLARWGIHAEVCWFPSALHPAPTPLPRVPHVIMYGGTEAYGLATFDTLRTLPGVRFTVWRYGDHTTEQVRELIESSTCIIQPGYLHGGIIVREAGEAGRLAVTTYDLPHTAKVAPGDAVACRTAVEVALARTGPDMEAARYWAEHNSVAAFKARVARFL